MWVASLIADRALVADVLFLGGGQLFVPGSSEWLVRVSKSPEMVLLELTTRAVELGLLNAAVLATVILQSGKSID